MTVKRNELLGRLALAIRTSQNVSEAFDDRVAEILGINRTDLRCLDVLEQRGPMTAGQLADAMHLSTGAVTTLLDRLERVGYARRVRDTEDRRRVLVELAPEVRERSNEFYEPLFEGTVRLLEGRSDRELERMIDFLEQGTAMAEQELEKLERGPG
jgi:DNA-binding MarR family transcriptional regulator